MALSRIWAAFIIISVLIAGIKYAFVPAEKDILGSMVTGKAGDTLWAAGSKAEGSKAEGSKAEGSKAARSSIAGAKPSELSPSELSPADARPADAKPAGAKPAGAGIQSSFRIQSADGLIATCASAVTLSLGLIGIMAFFMGLLGIAEQAGGIRLLSRLTSPFFSRLFPEIPKGHPSIGHMMMNFSANLMGLDNAATPFALKAMESLQDLNPQKETASNSQIMFLCLHASGLQMIPVSVIALRAANHSPDPTDVFVPIVIATFAATVASMSIVAAWQRIRIFQPVILAWIGSISLIIGALVVYLRSLDSEHVQSFSRALSGGLILLIILLIVLGGVYKKVNIFGAFVEGAKGGFETAVRIIPYLVGMLVAISLLRTSGTFDVIIDGMRRFFSALGVDTRFVEGLPTALVKPFTSAGARGMMVSTMMGPKGADSFAARLSGILQGSSESTFYVVAVYFGSVAIKNTRYSIAAMLLADLVGIVTSILLCYLFFPHAI